MKWISSLFLLSFLLSGCVDMAALQQDYQRNYRENNCNYDGAFKMGMNDAQNGAQMNGQVSHLCDVGIRPTVEKGYRDGYLNYMNSAPRKVEININGSTPTYDGGPTPSYPGTTPGFGGGSTPGFGTTPGFGGGQLVPVQACEFTTDCRFEKNCRDRGDGMKICLGHEPRGGFCEYSTDCDMGLFCRKENNIGRCR